MKYLILLCSTFLISCYNEDSKGQFTDRSLILKEFVIDVKDNKDDQYLYEKYFDKKHEQFRTFFQQEKVFQIQYFKISKQ
jgi:hypothetical protein